ncbi:MAG: hypothetical protein RL341_232, partial [Pseudomonadota bacterium]
MKLEVTANSSFAHGAVCAVCKVSQKLKNKLYAIFMRVFSHFALKKRVDIAYSNSNLRNLRADYAAHIHCCVIKIMRVRTGAKTHFCTVGRDRLRCLFNRVALARTPKRAAHIIAGAVDIDPAREAKVFAKLLPLRVAGI